MNRANGRGTYGMGIRNCPWCGCYVQLKSILALIFQSWAELQVLLVILMLLLQFQNSIPLLGVVMILAPSSNNPGKRRIRAKFTEPACGMGVGVGWGVGGMWVLSTSNVVIAWERFPHNYWTFVLGTQWSPVDPNKRPIMRRIGICFVVILSNL